MPKSRMIRLRVDDVGRKKKKNELPRETGGLRYNGRHVVRSSHPINYGGVLSGVVTTYRPLFSHLWG